MPTHTRLCLVVLLAAVLTSNCAQHTLRMDAVRTLMAQENYEQALLAMNKMQISDNDALLLLEKALLMHYVGQYAESNRLFEQAERISDELYTKSISREAAALITSDLALKYAPKPFEQVMINYYRALNYAFIDQREEALVECRKAVEKLERFSQEDKRPYRRDAFIEYLTGMLYEWDYEINDAWISYTNASLGYQTYRDLFGVEAPHHLVCDILRTAEQIGFSDEVEDVDSEERRRCAREMGKTYPVKLVIFVEQGLMPPKQQLSANIPILKDEAESASDKPYDFSLKAHSRMHGYDYDPGDLDYILSVALPTYPEAPARGIVPRIFVDSVSTRPIVCEDIYEIARAEFEHDLPGIFAKTLARAIVKYKATKAAKKEWGLLAGTLVDVATSAAEQADLRGWLSLPRAINMVIVYVEPGRHTVSLGRPVAMAGGGPSARSVEIDAPGGTTHFIRFRVY